MTEPQQQIPLIWPNVQDVSVLRANQFLGQIAAGIEGQPEEFLLSIGYAAPPVLLGTPEEQQLSMQAVGAISVKTEVRVSMSRGHLAALTQLLATALENFPDPNTNTGG
ncbi:MAG: hypothetical protein JWO46_86 [Nocardioidaceae bacterium]|nr:hypothetical protein [Nocardioidaceae bacterium]